MNNRTKLLAGLLLVAVVALPLVNLSFAKPNEKPAETARADSTDLREASAFTEAEQAFIEDMEGFEALEMERFEALEKDSRTNEINEIRQDQNFEQLKQSMEDLKNIDSTVGKILSKRLNDESLYSQALSLDKTRDTEIMWKIVTLLEDQKVRGKEEVYLFIYLYKHLRQAGGDPALVERLRGIMEFTPPKPDLPPTPEELRLRQREDAEFKRNMEAQLALGRQFHQGLAEAAAKILQKISGDAELSDQMLNIEQLTSKEQLQVLQKVFQLVQHPQGISEQDLGLLADFVYEFASYPEDPALQALEEKVKDLRIQRNKEREFSQVTQGEKRSYFQTGWQKAVKYALKHAHNYNPEYKDWDGEGGDCANFVSQALRAGGLAMHARGRSIQDQDASKYVGDNEEGRQKEYWYSEKKGKYSKSSASWRGAAAFENFWSEQVQTKDFSAQEVLDGKWWKFWQYGRGDVIQLVRNGREFHTYLITDKRLRYAENRGYYFTFSISAHSINRRNYSLSQIINDDPDLKGDNYKFKFFAIK